MKLEYIANQGDRAIAHMVRIALTEKRIRLNSNEIEIIKQAQRICEKAHQLLREFYQDDDLMTDYGLADHALSDILES